MCVAVHAQKWYILEEMTLPFLLLFVFGRFSGGSGDTQRLHMMLFDSISGGIKSAVENRSVAGQPAGKSLTEIVDCFLSLCNRGQNEAGFSVLSPVYRTYSCCIRINVFLYVFVCDCMNKKEWGIRIICILSAPWFFTLFMYTWICAGEPRSTQYWSEYNPSTLWVTKLWKQTIPAVSKKTDYLKNGEKQENRLFTVYSAATATGLQKWGVSQPSKELVVFSPPLLIYII